MKLKILRVRKPASVDKYRIMDENQNILFVVYDEETAEHIVKCVNSHEKLIGALTTASIAICQLCYRLNPHHATENQGRGCNSCEEMDSYKQAIKEAE